MAVEDSNKFAWGEGDLAYRDGAGRTLSTEEVRQAQAVAAGVAEDYRQRVADRMAADPAVRVEAEEVLNRARSDVEDD